MEKTDLTPKLSKNICEMIEENKPAEEIRKACGVSANTFRHWIEQAVLLSTQDLDTPLSQLRDAIIARVLKDNIMLGLLKAATQPSEKITRKNIILTALSRADQALLAKNGHKGFIEKVKDKIILRVEETIETIPPQPALYREILKVLDTNETESKTTLMDFNPVHKDLPPV